MHNLSKLMKSMNLTTETTQMALFRKKTFSHQPKNPLILHQWIVYRYGNMNFSSSAELLLCVI